jgi:predicted glycosyltransferase
MTNTKQSTSSVTRVMHYCHDTFGLGHLRRTLTLAQHLQASIPNLTQLIVTGSPAAQDFHVPPGTDYIKLPAVTKNGDGEYEPRTLATSLRDIRDMRSDIVLSAATHFRPDILIVDHAPAGFQGEMRDTLRYLRAECPRTRILLGLRDIVDDAGAVRTSWTNDGVYDLLDNLYDQVLVYGARHIYDVVEQYGFSAPAAAKTRFVGYLGGGPGPSARHLVRDGLAMGTDRLVVVTGGGGGDGQALLSTMIRGVAAVKRPAPFDCVLIGGQLMASREQVMLRSLASELPNVHFIESTNDMTRYIEAADVVVSMGGYNTFCEVQSVGRPAIIVPRIAPRQEQLIRARLFSERGVVRMIHPHKLTPDHLVRETTELLDAASPVPSLVPLDGLRNVVDALGELLPKAGPAPASRAWSVPEDMPHAVPA